MLKQVVLAWVKEQLGEDERKGEVCPGDPKPISDALGDAIEALSGLAASIRAARARNERKQTKRKSAAKRRPAPKRRGARSRKAAATRRSTTKRRAVRRARADVLRDGPVQ